MHAWQRRCINSLPIWKMTRISQTMLAATDFCATSVILLSTGFWYTMFFVIPYRQTNQLEKNPVTVVAKILVGSCLCTAPSRTRLFALIHSYVTSPFLLVHVFPTKFKRSILIRMAAQTLSTTIFLCLSTQLLNSKVEKWQLST